MKKTVESLLAGYNPEVRELAAKARALVFNVITGANEQVDTSAKIIAYGLGAKMADTICVIMPQKSYVNLGFCRGIELPDPEKLLEGTGKPHRHVKIRTVAEVNAPLCGPCSKRRSLGREVH